MNPILIKNPCILAKLATEFVDHRQQDLVLCMKSCHRKKRISSDSRMLSRNRSESQNNSSTINSTRVSIAFTISSNQSVRREQPPLATPRFEDNRTWNAPSPHTNSLSSSINKSNSMHHSTIPMISQATKTSNPLPCSIRLSQNKSHSRTKRSPFPTSRISVDTLNNSLKTNNSKIPTRNWNC